MTTIKSEFIETGNLRGYLARPTQGPAPAVIVYMEIFGVGAHVQNACNRLAQWGYAAFALDFYHGETYANTDLNGAIAKIKSLSTDTIMSETKQAIAFLKNHKEVLKTKVGTLGFCNGGRLSFLAATTFPDDIGASVCFYGGGIDNPDDRLGRPSVLGGVPKLTAPLMLFYGAKDASISAEEHGRIAESLTKANKRYTMSVFPDVGHAFMDQPGPAEAQATQMAWHMTEQFLHHHLKEKM